MRVLLRRAARINHKAGEIVEVSPADARFLVGIGAAEIIKATDAAETPEKPTQKRETRKKK